MKRTMIMAAGVGALLIGLGSGQAAMAQAQSGQQQHQQRQQPPAGQPAPTQVIPMEQVLSRLRADGYGEIYEVEREGGRYEVKAKNQQGRRVELYVDARTGETLKIETH